MRHAECWGCPGTVEWSTGEAFPEAHGQVSSWNLWCDVLQEIYLPHFLPLPISYSCSSWFSIRMVWEINQPLWQHPTWLGKPYAHSHTLPSLHGIIHRPRNIFLDLKLYCLGRGVMQVNIQLAFTHSNRSKYLSFYSFEMMKIFCWRFELYFLYMYYNYKYVQIDFSIHVLSFFGPILSTLFVFLYFTFLKTDFFIPFFLSNLIANKNLSILYN